MIEQDAYLLDRWNSHGDSQSFMEIVARYQGMVYAVCLRILRDHGKAEDLVQECFFKLTRTRPKSVDALGPWLHRVAINQSLNRLRTNNSSLFPRKSSIFVFDHDTIDRT
jgi:RNA polymerase sigma-70 factor (ECF subfamily)